MGHFIPAVFGRAIVGSKRPIRILPTFEGWLQRLCSHVYLKTEHNVDWGHRNISSILSQLMGSLCLARSLSLRRMKMASMPVALASHSLGPGPVSCKPV